MMIKNKPLCLLCNVTATGRQAAVSSVSVPDLVQLHSHSDNSQSHSPSIALSLFGKRTKETLLVIFSHNNKSQLTQSVIHSLSSVSTEYPP